MPRTTSAAASVPAPTAPPADAAELLARARTDNVRFLRLQFTDILGVNKNVEVPASRFAEALAGEVLFDGSAIEGFARPEESDMLLRPDLSTYGVLPFAGTVTDDAVVARVICDVTTTDGAAFAGDPRAVLRRQLAAAADRGYAVRANVEVEFFLFRAGPDGAATTATHDVGGYFDLAPVDLGEEARRAMVDLLERLGVPVVGAHHEGAHGQHEIDVGDADALAAADHVVTLRFIVKHVARRFGLVASFMPKPVFGQNGSGMHTHQALVTRRPPARGANGASPAFDNAFADPDAEWGLSRTALHYVGGLLRHARGMCAVTNPLVNSYKRLVPGFEAPVHVAWSLRSRTPLVRVPERRGAATRLEVRTPDPAANPYLALAVMIAAGLDGVATDAEWREPVAQEVAEMSWRERRRLRNRRLAARPQ